MAIRRSKKKESFAIKRDGAKKEPASIRDYDPVIREALKDRRVHISPGQRKALGTG